jgi:hypothetical protein
MTLDRNIVKACDAQEAKCFSVLTHQLPSQRLKGLPKNSDQSKCSANLLKLLALSTGLEPVFSP